MVIVTAIQQQRERTSGNPSGEAEFWYNSGKDWELVKMAQAQRQKQGIAEIIGDKRDEILQLAAKYGAYNVRVFGSVARGEAREDSDIDFLVQFKEGSSIFDEVGLWLDLKALMQREVDLSTDETLKAYIRPSALRDAVAL